MADYHFRPSHFGAKVVPGVRGYSIVRSRWALGIVISSLVMGASLGMVSAYIDSLDSSAPSTASNQERWLAAVSNPSNLPLSNDIERSRRDRNRSQSRQGDTQSNQTESEPPSGDEPPEIAAVFS